eukprot:786489-Prymnesium_polylepis.1
MRAGRAWALAGAGRAKRPKRQNQAWPTPFSVLRGAGEEVGVRSDRATKVDLPVGIAGLRVK